MRLPLFISRLIIEKVAKVQVGPMYGTYSRNVEKNVQDLPAHMAHLDTLKSRPNKSIPFPCHIYHMRP